MSYPTIFANLAAGNEPLSLFDTMFNIAGQQGNIPCTASGTNAITLTPNTNYYLPAAYTNAQIVSFKAVATSAGSVTIQVGGLSLVKLFTAAGVQAASGDIVLNTHYTCQYWSDLDTGAGGFIILNATVTAIANTVQGVAKNLKITNGGTPNTQVALTADAVVVQNNSGGTARVTSVSLTILTTTTGANALDTGTVASSTWYYVYVIYNSGSSTTAGLLSLSSTAPALPGGYTYFARLGAVITDGSANLLRTLQLGNRAQYIVGTNPTVVPLIASSAGGAVGTYSTTSPVLAAASITGVVPTTASEIKICVSISYKGVAAGGVLIAPNVNWGGTNNGPLGSNGQNWPFFSNAGGTYINYGQVQMVLETTSVAWCTSGTSGALSCLGWVDNL